MTEMNLGQIYWLHFALLFYPFIYFVIIYIYIYMRERECVIFRVTLNNIIVFNNILLN